MFAARLLAGRAHAQQFEHVIFDAETCLVSDLPDERRKILLSGELHHLLAATADQVVSMRPLPPGVAVAPLGEMDASRYAELRIERQRAVHRHQTQRRAIAAGPGVDLFGAQPIIRLGEHPRHGSARRGEPVAALAQFGEERFAYLSLPY